MSYLELNLDLTDEQLMLRDNIRKFALEVMRPTAMKLDQMTPEEVIAPDSIFWDCMKQAYKLGLHKILIPEEYRGARSVAYRSTHGSRRDGLRQQRYRHRPRGQLLPGFSGLHGPY